MSLFAQPLDVSYDIDGLRAFVDYRSIAEVLRSPSFGYGFHDRAWNWRTLGWIDRDEHTHRRRLEARLFDADALRRYEREILGPQVDGFFDQCRDERPDGGTFAADLVELAHSWLVRISTTISGIDGVDSHEKALRFLDLSEGNRSVYHWKAAPETKRRGELDREARRALIYEEFYRPSLERRSALVAEVRCGVRTDEDLPSDLLTLLLRSWDPTWDDDLAFREVLLFMSGAIGTTVISIVHLVHHLDEWFREHPDDRARSTDLTFLRRAAYESLRLHPVIPVMMRRAHADVTLSSGVEVKEGERVALLYGQGNRDPKVFGDHPDRFDPYRRPLVEAITGYGLAFALGEHMCIGRNLAIGIPSARRDGEPAPIGTLLTMTQRLQQAGVQPDPRRPAVYDWDSAFDKYTSYPVVLTAL